MRRGTAPRVLTVVAVVTLLAALVGFITTMVLNAFVLDEYDAYGEVPIPGSSSLHLPEGEVIVSFHTIIIGSGDGRLPVPAMSIHITPPDGVPDPVLTEDIGGTTTVNNDARVRVWIAQVAAEGTYVVSTDGNVSAFLEPRLAFGHGSRYGYLPVVFAVVFGIALVGLLVVRAWAVRVANPESPVGLPTSFTPTDEGIRLQQLETLARLRDSGALTHDEYETERKRVLDGL